MDLALRLREQHGISVRTEWLDGVLSQLRAANGDATIASWSEAQVFEHIFTAFLFCDLNQSGAAALPPDAKSLHKQVLKGRYVLQVDEVVNAAAAAKERYTGEGGSRCLKLALTDGCQQVVAVEYSPLPSLAWDCPAGSKLLLHDVPVRRGLLLLGPGNAVLLGGQVERTEAARQRAVAAWNKPVVGRPAGAGPRDIFGEARRAAWAPGEQQQQQEQQARAGQQPHQQGNPGAAAPHGVPGGPPAAAPVPAPPNAARGGPGQGSEGAVGARQWSLGGGAGVGPGVANGLMLRPQQAAQQQQQQHQQQAPRQLQGPPVPPLPGEAGAPSSSGWLGRGAAQAPHAAPTAQPAHVPLQQPQGHQLHRQPPLQQEQHRNHPRHNDHPHPHQQHQPQTQRTQPTQPVQQTPLTVPRPALARPALPPVGTAAAAPSASAPLAVRSAQPPASVGVSGTAAGGSMSGGGNLGGASGAAGIVQQQGCPPRPPPARGVGGVPGGPPVYDLISSSSSEDEGDGATAVNARRGVVGRSAGPAPGRPAAAAADAAAGRRAAGGLAGSDDSASEGGWEQERAGGDAGASAAPGAQRRATPGNVEQNILRQDEPWDDMTGAVCDAVEGGGAAGGALGGTDVRPSSSRLKRLGGPLPAAAPGVPATGMHGGPAGLDSGGRAKRHGGAGLPPSAASSPAVPHTSMKSIVTGVTPAGTPAVAAAAAAGPPGGDVGSGSAGGSSSTLSGSKKPCLPLARSSPRPIFAPLSSSGAAVGRTPAQPPALAQAGPLSSGAAAVAPAAAAMAPPALGNGARAPEGSGGPCRGRAGGGGSAGASLFDTDDVMDLAALDDEAGHVPYEYCSERYGGGPSPGAGADAGGAWEMGAGGSGGGGGCDAGPGRRLHGGSSGGRTRALEPPLEPPGGDEKRQRLVRSGPGPALGEGPGSGAGLGGFPAGVAAALDGALGGEGPVGVVPATQLDVGSLMEEEPMGEGRDMAGGAGCGVTGAWGLQLVQAAATHPSPQDTPGSAPGGWQGANPLEAGPSRSHAQRQRYHTPPGDNCTASPGHLPAPSACPRDPSPGPPPQPAAYGHDTNQFDPQPHHQSHPQLHVGAEPQPEPEHVGLLLLCQVRELVACTDINTRGAGGSQGAGGGLCFPLRVDVCGVFHSLQGDEVEIEDGTALVAARVGEALGEPLVRAAAAIAAATGTPPPAPPGGTVRPEDLTLDAVYDMVGHDDPAVRQYGEGLANHLMEFVRTFSGVITLQYDGPNGLPTILRLVPDNDSDEDDLHGSGQHGAVSQGLAQLPYMVPCGQGSGGGRTTLYERCLRELQVLGPLGEDV